MPPPDPYNKSSGDEHNPPTQRRLAFHALSSQAHNCACLTLAAFPSRQPACARITRSPSSHATQLVSRASPAMPSRRLRATTPKSPAAGATCRSPLAQARLWAASLWPGASRCSSFWALDAFHMQLSRCVVPVPSWLPLYCILNGLRVLSTWSSHALHFMPSSWRSRAMQAHLSAASLWPSNSWRSSDGALDALHMQAASKGAGQKESK